MQARAIVEIRFGPLQGKKAVITAGDKLCVGRTDFSQFVVPHDSLLSAQHFEVSWDGNRCLVRDLESIKGTSVAGESIKEAEIEHGGWIRAGETDFLVHFEGHIPPRDEEDVDDLDDEIRERVIAERASRGAAVEKALAALRGEAKKHKLYAVLDAARDERILQLLRQNIEEYRSLYDGVEGDTMAHVAPYLAGPMREDSRLLEALVREGWGKRWGMYCTSGNAFKDVRRHFRRFLMVEDEDSGERLYFRFYDPGVMRIFWPTCSVRQKEELMGELGAYWVEGEDLSITRFSVAEDLAI